MSSNKVASRSSRSIAAQSRTFVMAAQGEAAISAVGGSGAAMDDVRNFLTVDDPAQSRLGGVDHGVPFSVL
ncbi:hypothetical protein [Mycobacterium sp. C31M]